MGQFATHENAPRMIDHRCRVGARGGLRTAPPLGNDADVRLEQVEHEGDYE